MIGAGVSIVDLMNLFKAVKEKKMTLKVKIIDGPWEDVNADSVKRIIEAVLQGKIVSADEVRLRLYKNNE